MSVPNPNTFGGPVQVKLGRKDWAEIPLTHPNEENSRSIGVADMAHALRSGRPHRANGDLTFHVLDLMHAFHEAQQSGAFVELSSTCEQPAMIPTGLQPGQLDD